MTEVSVIPVTMSSLEIAAATGKNHRDVLRDIRKMLEELGEGAVLKFEDRHVNHQNGQTYPCFNLPRREVEILLTGIRSLSGRSVWTAFTNSNSSAVPNHLNSNLNRPSGRMPGNANGTAGKVQRLSLARQLRPDSKKPGMDRAFLCVLS